MIEISKLWCVVATIFVLGAQGFIGLKPRVTRMRHKMGVEMKVELDPNVGYGPFGSLTRQGPVPLFIRLTNPDTYEAAVDKYARQEGCSRLEAMANMDAYFADPNGWAGDKLREKNGKMPPRDYINVNQNPFNLALTAIWAVGILGLFWRIFQVQILGV